MQVTIREIQTELNVFDLYTIFKGQEDVILLESSKDKERLGKYSFIGLNPFKTIKYKSGVLSEDGESKSEDPFGVLNRLLSSYKIENKTEIPFIGGCMGYLAYDLVRDMEKLPDTLEDVVSIPSLYFVFYDNVLIYDHYQGRVYISELVRMSGGISKVEDIIKQIEQGSPVEKFEVKQEALEFVSPFSKASYMQGVDAMRAYIRSGDVYIANMTHTYTAKTHRSGYDLYKVLRTMNKAPFSAYMPLDGFEVICSSPERFMQVRNGKVETRPIKGTRPRGRSEVQDERMRHELEMSEKDKSELLMIVDLERNDLSKVCRPYTVKVTELFNIESYATVHHLVSTVVGELAKGKTAVDLMKACFPGGSITGAPKIRAMEVIEELEKNRRNLYTGCIGYFGFDGSCDFNIVIRTLLKQGDELSVGVGGGITWESDAQAEYEETLDKAKVLFEAASMVIQ